MPRCLHDDILAVLIEHWRVRDRRTDERTQAIAYRLYSCVLCYMVYRAR